jgi:hypothetical protein
LGKYLSGTNNMQPVTDFFSQRVSIPDHVLMRELDGESVILDLASENYFGLDEIGTRLWQLLVDAQTIGGIYESFLAEYNVEPQQLQTDLQDFVNHLVEKKLLTLELVEQE